MATHRAKVQCFHNAHLFEVGEEATFAPDQNVPEHFEKIEAPEEVVPEESVEDKKARKKS